MQTLSKKSRIKAKLFHEGIICNKYIPHEPTIKQAEFLFHLDLLEGFYGGAAGGGKVMRCLQQRCSLWMFRGTLHCF